jgi:hypothetical protein
MPQFQATERGVGPHHNIVNPGRAWPSDQIGGDQLPPFCAMMGPVRLIGPDQQNREEDMFRTILLAAAFAFTATSSLASHCPQDAAAIDHALTVTTLDDAAKAEIQTLRDEGMALHEAGNHAESEAMLADAMRRLLLAAE